MPPSVPPERPVTRRMPVSVRTISSCACDPRMRASSKPSPTSTPLIAWIPISAPASRESRRRSPWTWLPRPGGKPVREHLDDPAEGVPRLLGRLDLGDHRRARRGVEAPHLGRVDGIEVVRAGHDPGRRAATDPMPTTWLTTSAPSACRRNALGHRRPARPGPPSRGRSRARAPGARRPGRTSACRPGRRGRAAAGSAARCAPARRVRRHRPGRRPSPSSTSATRMLPMRIAIGPPMVIPCRTPPVSSTSSCSNFIRAPRP